MPQAIDRDTAYFERDLDIKSEVFNSIRLSQNMPASFRGFLFRHRSIHHARTRDKRKVSEHIGGAMKKHNCTQQ